jgi:hypothetical protein
MTRARTGDEELMVEQVERLGARRLAEIVINHCHRNEGLRQTVRIALAASAPGHTLLKTLATEIDAIRAARRFYGYRESNALADELDRVREGIARDLLPTQPRAAAELLGRLIRLDASVYERSDDSDGVIGDAIGEAVTDCGRAWAVVHDRDPKVLAAEVFDLFTTDEYGARSEVITAFAMPAARPVWMNSNAWSASASTTHLPENMSTGTAMVLLARAICPRRRATQLRPKPVIPEIDIWRAATLTLKRYGEIVAGGRAPTSQSAPGFADSAGSSLGSSCLDLACEQSPRHRRQRCRRVGEPRKVLDAEQNLVLRYMLIAGLGEVRSNGGDGQIGIEGTGERVGRKRPVWAGNYRAGF